MSTIEKKLKENGPVAVKNYLKKKFGEKADNVIKVIDDVIDASVDDVGKWAKGSYDTTKDSLIDHFYRHGQDVGATDVDQYLRKAQEFSKNLKNARSYPAHGYTEGATKYVKNNKYVILDSNKNILSFGTVE